MKISKCIHKFLLYLEVEKNKSQKTIENYQHYLSRFLNFFGDCPIQTIKLEQIQDYRLYLNRQKFGVQEKELSKKNQQKLDIYKKKLGHTNIDEKVSQIEEIIFRNFDINESNFEIIRAYIDEYFDRFIKLEKTITVTLLSLEKVVTKLSRKIESKN